ncbi:MAG: sulfotransferase family protein [Planctomycetes bacterium]|nr:sulfotransferase family protein [Planctomycetota bacterium]
MLLSIEKNFLFVHVPKTGGTSVTRALNPWAVHPPLTPINKLLSRFRLQRDPAKVRLRVHGSLEDAYAQLPRDFANSLFKFAFVRNPWDRLVSEYSFILARKNHPRHAEVKALPDFLAYLYYEKTRARGRGQAQMLSAPADRPPIDFVGRFESLRTDFSEACTRIGIDASLPHLNQTKHRDYRDFYDETSRSYVAEAWAEEIQEFGYEF